MNMKLWWRGKLYLLIKVMCVDFWRVYQVTEGKTCWCFVHMFGGDSEHQSKGQFQMEKKKKKKENS